MENETKPKVEEIINFPATFKMINGKKTLVIKTHTERIVHPDGRVDVIIKVPTLDLINKTIEGSK